VVRTADHRDPAVPELDEVAGGRPAAGPVRRPDEGDIVVQLVRGVEHHERDVLGA